MCDNETKILKKYPRRKQIFSRIIWESKIENLTLVEYLDQNPDELEAWNKASEGLTNEEMYYLQNK